MFLAEFSNFILGLCFNPGGPLALTKQSHLTEEITLVEISDDDLLSVGIFDENGD